MSKKSISINPTFFKISGGGKQKKKKKKPSFEKNKLKPNDIKKKLIAKIKAHQKKELDKEKEARINEESQFKNEFQETLAYLQEMKKKKAKKKLEKKNRTMKKKQNAQQKPIINDVLPLKSDITVDINPMKNSPDPPYGCLKNGNKPTFRQYNKTLKKNKEEIKNEFSKKPLFNLKSTDFEVDEKFNDRKNKLENIKNKIRNSRRKNSIRIKRL